MISSRSKRSSKIDSLELLREYTMSKKEIVKRDQFLQFESTKLDLKAPTAWKKNNGGYYSLGDLWLFLYKVEQNMANKVYFNQRQEFSLEGIEKIDEDDIMSYFQGKIDNCDKIDQEAKQQLLNNTKKPKSAEGASQEPNLVKKRKLSGEGEAKTIEMQQRDQHLNAINWIVKTEKPLTSRTRILRSKYNTNVNLKQFFKYLEDGKAGTTSSGMSTSSSSASDAMKSTINYPCLYKDLREKRLRPIIVVPTMGRAGNISLFNSKKFLDVGEYEDPEKKDISSSDRVVTFERKIRGYPFVFEVYDSVGTFEPSKMNQTQKSKWERVVAVFVTGQKYQFKEWPNQDNIPNILDQVRGFYLQYNETPTPEQVANWNVKVVNVFRHKRHLDKPAHDQFWTELENFLVLPKNKHR